MQISTEPSHLLLSQVCQAGAPAGGEHLARAHGAGILSSDLGCGITMLTHLFLHHCVLTPSTWKSHVCPPADSAQFTPIP